MVPRPSSLMRSYVTPSAVSLSRTKPFSEKVITVSVAVSKTTFAVGNGDPVPARVTVSADAKEQAIITKPANNVNDFLMRFLPFVYDVLA